MSLLSSATLDIETQTQNDNYYTEVLHWNKQLGPVNPHGLEDGAGEVLGAEAGEEGGGHGRQEGHHLDLEPELDELRVLQVLPGQRRRFRLREDLVKVRAQLVEVLGGVGAMQILVFTSKCFGNKRFCVCDFL